MVVHQPEVVVFPEALGQAAKALRHRSAGFNKYSEVTKVYPLLLRRQAYQAEHLLSQPASYDKERRPSGRS